MASPSGINSGVGFRHVQILRLDDNGTIYSTGTTVYEGVVIGGAKALTITDPEPRQIVHTGDDSVFALDTLPPQEPMSGEMRTGKQADALDSLLSGVNVVTVGEASLFPVGTDKRGSEIQVGLPSGRRHGSGEWNLRQACLATSPLPPLLRDPPRIWVRRYR
jgi:hypothetical protein